MEISGQLNWRETVVKDHLKREIYSIYVMNGKFYLSPESQTNSDFIHDIMVGKKKVSDSRIN